MQNLKFEVIRMHPNFTNSILVSVGADAVIFDPWGTVDAWVKVLDDNKLKLHAIYATHGHFDHISAAPMLADKLNVPWYMNHRDLPLIPTFNEVLQYYKLPMIPDNFKQPIDLKQGAITVLPGLDALALETPGHSAGGMAFYFPTAGALIIGDTLFGDTVGRYDLPGASEEELIDSIAKIYDMNLPDNTVVIHGHGMDSTIGGLKKHNMYFVGTSDLTTSAHKCCGGHCHEHDDHEHKCCGGSECGCKF
ncbi:MBL fold metallo-hydrolase [Lachnospiraceae bacterium OttesenSCG-928-E19]|nr:MBL fold metallo-hydrolase [Lachnospiraceae bacterium OttesenSCG-928-E19]